MILKKLSVAKMRPDPNQPRREFDETVIRTLGASLKEDGQYVPVITYPVGEFECIADGEQRWRAAQFVGITELDAIVLDGPPSPAELLKLQLKVNCLRKELSPLERAWAYQRWLEQEQGTQSALAEMLQLSDGTVSNYLSLIKAPPEIQVLVDSGKLPVSSVAAIMRAKDRPTQLALAEQSAAGTLSRDAVQSRVRKKKSDGIKAKRIRCLWGDCTVTLASQKRMDFDRVLNVLETLAREARRARAQKLDVLTWERVLHDRAEAGCDNAEIETGAKR